MRGLFAHPAPAPPRVHRHALPCLCLALLCVTVVVILQTNVRKIPRQLHPPAYLAAARDGVRSAAHILPICDSIALINLPLTAYASTFNCLCNATVPRKPSCKLLLLQSGDFSGASAPTRRAAEQPPLHIVSHAAVAAYAALHGYSHLFVDVAGMASTVPRRGKRRKFASNGRAAAWLKLPIIHAMLPYFDDVAYIDGDVAPGADASLSLSHIVTLLHVRNASAADPATTELLNTLTTARHNIVASPGGLSPVAVFAGNAPSGDGPCTGFFVVIGAAHSTDAAPNSNSSVFLQRWWASPDESKELAPYKMRRVWEQHALDAYWRWNRHGFRDAIVVLKPKIMADPDSTFFTHVWSDIPDRKEKLWQAFLTTIATALVACRGDLLCGQGAAPLIKADRHTIVRHGVALGHFVWQPRYVVTYMLQVLRAPQTFQILL